MIVRTWRGRASSVNAPAYVRHFQGNVLPELRGIAGFRGALLLRDQRGEEVEFFVLTKWASMDAVRSFAGDDVERAVVEPEGVAALTSFDPNVRHYEVVDEISVPG
jgi:heme-degrading monooxygenase HmoA